MSQSVVLDNRLLDLVDPGLEPEKIAGGCVFTEGPLWDHRDSTLIFSDVRDNTMYRWSEEKGQEVLRKPSGVSNGNTFDLQGRMVTCEHENRRVSRTLADGSVETLVSHFEGKRLSSPNDIVCAPNGDLYFTDPPYGLRLPDGSFGPQEVPFNGVYRIAAEGGAVSLVVDDFVRPNGIVISSDGNTVSVCDTDQHVVRSFDRHQDGSLTNGRVFVDVSHGSTTGRPDGMKLDAAGNLYIAANTAEGVWVYAPDGTLLGFIGLPESPANVAWGGAGNQMLFITAQTSVYRLGLKVSGQPVLGAS